MQRPARLIKTPVFLACEGLGEQGYGRWLNRLADDLAIPVVVQASSVGGGDPLDLVEKSIHRLRRLEKQRGPHRLRGLLLDRDCFGRDQDRDRLAIAKARKTNIHLLWQAPCHEVFIIHHFHGYEEFNPRDEADFWRTMQAVWPEYTKGMDASGYGTKLTQDHLARARAVEVEFDRFLVRIGWHSRPY